MGNLLEQSLVRIFNQAGDIVGIGFLISNDQIITCSHTIAVALGISRDTKECPVNIINFDFPFVKKNSLLDAIVAYWYPKANDEGDIAILCIKSSKPNGTEPIKFLSSGDYSGHLFTAYGCPRNFQNDGRWVEGKLQRLLPNGRLQAIGISDLGYFIEQGFSGSPVWDQSLGGVVGIIMSVDQIKDKMQASILPTNTLLKIHPTLPVVSQVYISSSRIDGNKFAEKLRKELSSRNFRVTENLIPLDDIKLKFTEGRGVEQIDAMIVVLTPCAVDSKQVESEWNFALDLKIPIIPVLFEDCDFPRVLSILDYVDFRVLSKFDDQINSLVDQLQNIGNNHFVARYENLTGIKPNINTKYPIVVGQRITSTVEYFQDRQDQLVEIGRLLSLSGTRIVSVIGSGGIGKTALVSRFLFDLEQNIWPHTSDGTKVNGILYLSHRTVGITLERLFLDCAELLGGSKKYRLQQIWLDVKLEINEKIKILFDMINEGVYIILLDNIEDLLDNAGNFIVPELNTFFELCFATPGNAKLLVTTREPITFNSKDAPLDKQILLDKGLDIDYGIAMLRQADPSGLYGLKDADEKNLSRIVTMVHGIPRALEVFAGIVKDETSALMTLEEVMEQFFKHPITEKELIKEGYRRLDPPAQKVLEGLAVFNRPVPIAAVKYLLEPYMPNEDVTSIILRLIRIHMINVVDKQKKLVALHPIDRDFAYSQIPQQ
ncbi:MAG: TIR domain-containing protein [Candidatus Methanofastidiosa archaeon]|nr:TIR domain-containing protein [Candidatus Methanofastidiosa archaeon]